MESLALKNCRWKKVVMISLRQNQANVEKDKPALAAFEIFGNLIIQALFCGEKYTDFVHGFYGVDKMKFS